MSPSPSTPPRRPTLGGTIAAVGGLLLFAYFVRRAGLDDVAAGVRRLGWVFVVVVGLQGARFLTRAAAWMRCMKGEHRLTLGEVFQAVVAGDTLGNLTPLSLLVSEPAKAMFLRHREPVARTLAALAVENLFYTLSAGLMILSGAAALVLVLRAEEGLWLATSLLLVALVAAILTVHAVIWRHIRVTSRLAWWLRGHRVWPTLLARALGRARAAEDHVYALYPRDRARLLTVTLLEVMFHALAILEIFIVLSLISDRPPTVLDAFVFESTNRFIQVVFKVVPMRIGVDEAGTGMFADWLAFGTAAGVTLAIVRKARMLIWMAFGTAVLVRRGLSVDTVLSATTDRTALVVMARSPFAGAPPKTRLAADLDSEGDRRRLYAAFLEDTVAACRTVATTTLHVAYTPDGGREGLETMGIGSEELMPQRGDDLGTRERNIFADLFEAGFSRVVMIGSDLPTLPMAHIAEAADRTRPGAVVLGPSEDGGYYLIALAGAPDDAVPDLFSAVRWSTSSVLADTVESASRAGLDVVRLPVWYDVDTPEELARLRADLTDPTHADRAPKTAHVLRELFLRETGDRRPEPE